MSLSNFCSRCPVQWSWGSVWFTIMCLKLISKATGCDMRRVTCQSYFTKSHYTTNITVLATITQSKSLLFYLLALVIWASGDCMQFLTVSVMQAWFATVDQLQLDRPDLWCQKQCHGLPAKNNYEFQFMIITFLIIALNLALWK